MSKSKNGLGFNALRVHIGHTGSKKMRGKKLLQGRQIRRYKRGEISQVFMYITAMIVFAVVFFFGYRAIGDFMQKGKDVAFITFKTDLENAVRRVGPEFGSVVLYNAKNPLRISGGYKRACFVDMDFVYNEQDCLKGLDPITCDAWKTAGSYSGTDANVFLDPPAPNPIKVYSFEADTNGNGESDNKDKGYVCIDVRAGRLDIRIEGKGNKALIGPIPAGAQ